MIARTWHGRVPTPKAEAYHDYLRRTGLNDYASTPGNRGVYVFRREEGEATHYLLTTLWDSMDAIRRFAGPEPERARYYPEDDDFLLEREPMVTHHEVLAATDPERGLLRHTLSTLAYRSAKVLRDVPAGFGDFRLGDGTRTPVQILAHMGDLFDWALHLAEGRHLWRDLPPLPWEEEVTRYFAALARFDARLADGAPLACEAGQLFQGPIADALAHAGQLALLRRRAGAPVRGENYFKADIGAGRVGAEQPEARSEFD